MNKVQIVKNHVTKVVTKNITTKDLGILICTETYINGKLEDQFFKLQKPIHIGYKPSIMKFYYYNDNFNKIDMKSNYQNNRYNDITEPVLIHDLATFNRFDRLYCNWLSMDGHIYNIKDPEPIINIMSVTLNSSTYNLDKSKEKLSKMKFIKNITLVSNCRQNWESCGMHSLRFTIMPSPKLWKKVCKLHNSYEIDELVSNYLRMPKSKPNNTYHYEIDDNDCDS